MRPSPSLLAAAALAAVLASPALARGGGGDREPAGGAFMSSYPEQGSTGIQRGGPPRSADIPRGEYGYGGEPDSTGSVGPSPWDRPPPRW